MQNDFAHSDGYYAEAGRDPERIAEIVGQVSSLADAARLARVPVFFTRLMYDPRLPMIEERHTVMPSRWVARDQRLVPDSWGAQVLDELAPSPDDFVVEKSNYSAFAGTNLDETLRRLGRRTLILTGTVTYACVLHTAFDAFCLDYEVIVPRDGVSAWFDHLHEAALEVIDLILGRVVTTEELLEQLAGSGQQ